MTSAMDFFAGMAAIEGLEECSHPSMDGLGIDPIQVCMSCGRLVKAEVTNYTLRLTTLRPTDVKALFDELIGAPVEEPTE